MNRINRLFKEKSNILSIYFTAGHPTLNSTEPVIKALSDSGADMIEIGMPFSDPMADGPVIQSSSSVALKNGMSLKLMFSQLKDIRKITDIPLLLMGYLNPVLQYGVEKFCSDCAEAGIDGIILPDMPMDIYQEEYQQVFEKNGLFNIFLISPQTSDERIRMIDDASNGFIYMVSSSSTTGVKKGFSPEQVTYFERIRDMRLKNPSLVGFGISTHESFATVCQYARGAIIGSAFVKMLAGSSDLEMDIGKFIQEIRG
ncbi:MAG: tryptophan synthase subunit alpha [Bacteroidales bacterium]